MSKTYTFWSWALLNTQKKDGIWSELLTWKCLFYVIGFVWLQSKQYEVCHQKCTKWMVLFELGKGQSFYLKCVYWCTNKTRLKNSSLWLYKDGNFLCVACNFVVKPFHQQVLIRPLGVMEVKVRYCWSSNAHTTIWLEPKTVGTRGMMIWNWSWVS